MRQILVYPWCRKPRPLGRRDKHRLGQRVRVLEDLPERTEDSVGRSV
jgi:hypothetical protein